MEQSIGERFESLAARHPSRLAVASARHSWTYEELCARTLAVAQGLGPAAGERVALLFDHDAPMIAAMLGAARAGWAYVPLDTSHPRERWLQVVTDADARLILTDTANYKAASQFAGPRLGVIDIETFHPENRGAHWLPAVAPETIAYLLYTSGSTGQPKGVIQNHRNVIHHVRLYTNALGILPKDRLSLIPAYSFDASVMDIYGALLSGASLHLIRVREHTPEDFAGWIHREFITILHATPTVYRYLLNGVPAGRAFPSVRAVVMGGEEVVRRDVDLYRAHFPPPCLLINGLGPTESTLALQYVVNHDTAIPRNTVPVGYPVDATSIDLLGDSGEAIQGCGVGEIAIKSSHVALGYWRRPDLTALAFSTDAADPSLRIYRTGDLGRRLPDGRIEFAGRRDLQVKIRGYRIEPGEVESRMMEHPAITGAVVRAIDDGKGGKALAAYLVPSGTPRLDTSQLRAFLKERLPDYMVPAVFLPIPAVPLTSSGKVDRQALPAPDLLHLERADNYRAPESPAEKVLGGMWSALLNVPRVGLDDNFFDLGGHSLLATQMVARIRSTLQVDVSLRRFFETPTLQALAAVVEETERNRTAGGAQDIGSLSRALYRASFDKSGALVLPRILLVPSNQDESLPRSMAATSAAE